VTIGPAIGSRDKLNAEADLGQSDDADMKLVKQASANECRDPLFGLWPP
jgi:hypothetical protein